jgi:glyoxylase-like metal-dependent hydrolase (beta-lactamase superfamily II)
MFSEQIRPGMYQIRTPFDRTGTVFLYLLKGDRIALIDSGASDSPETVLEPALKEIGLALSDVDLILNTHAHLDHSGGNAEMKRRSKAQIHVHRLDLPMAESNDAQVEFHVGPLRRLGCPPEGLKERAEHVLRNAGEAAGADRVLSDGELIDLGKGIRLHAIHCPGHTPGHVVYHWESEGIGFTADAVQGIGARVGAFPYYFDAPSYRESLAKLSRLQCRLLCLGHAYHGGTLVNRPVREGAEAQAFLQASMHVADTIHQTVVEIIKARPEAADRETALAALDALLYDIPQLRNRQTGFPLLGGPTLLAHIDAVRAGTYPG